jgi:hypothetical protein
MGGGEKAFVERRVIQFVLATEQLITEQVECPIYRWPVVRRKSDPYPEKIAVPERE